MVFRLSIIVAVATVGSLFLANSAQAMTFNPPRFEFTVNPGDTIEDVIKIFNEGEKKVLELYVSTANFTHKEGDEITGTPEFYPGDEQRNGRELAPWIEISDEPITVFPRVRTRIPFKLNIPADTAPGGHFGAVIFSSAPADQDSGVGLVASTAVLLLVRVNGDVVEEATLTDFSTDSQFYGSLPVSFIVRVENKGTVHLQPKGTIKIRNMFGRQVELIEFNVAEKSVLPASARRYFEAWTNPGIKDYDSEFTRQWKSFALGKYTAELELEYGTEGQTFTAEYSFWVVPWMMLLTLVGGLVLVILIVRGLLQSYKKKIISQFSDQRK